MRAWVGVWLAAVLLTWPAHLSEAQNTNVVRSPVLVVESDRLYRESAYGQRIVRELSDQSADLAAENRRIEAALEAEEEALTAERPSLSPEEFRTLADAFDEKVRNTRREQEAKVRAIARRQESARAEFLTAIAPVLETLMQESGAAVILERRGVFLSRNAIDVTDDALARIDAEIGDGSNSPAPEAPPNDSGDPAPVATPAPESDAAPALTADGEATTAPDADPTQAPGGATD